MLRGYTSSNLVKKIIAELRLVESISRPLTIYCDNSVVVCFSQNNITKWSKYFGTKFMFIREMIQEFQTRVEHIPTEPMTADPLTKGLIVKGFVEHVTSMGVMRSFDYWFSGSFLLCLFTSRLHIIYCIAVFIEMFDNNYLFL